MARSPQHSIQKSLNWLVNIAIAIQLIFLLIIFFHGGFSFKYAGIRISAHSASQTLFVLIALVILKILVRAELKNAAVLLFSLLFSLLAAEAGLRILDLPIARTPELKKWRQLSETLGWELIPGVQGSGNMGAMISINSHGLRDAEHPWEKSGDKLRILALGDSFTYGYGLDLKDTYVKQLETLFSDHNPRVEVINGGVIGYNLYQSLAWFKEKGHKYHSDLVIYFFWLDDVEGPGSPKAMKKRYSALQEADKGNQKRSGVNIYVVNLLKNSKTLIDFRLRPIVGADWLKDVQKRKQYLATHTRNYQLGTQPVKQFEDNLIELRDAAVQSGAGFLTVIVPDAGQLNDPYLQEPNRVVNEICTRNHIKLLDTTPLFEKEEDVISLFLYPVDAHTSAKGDRLIAQAVHQKIVNLFQQFR